MIVQIEELLGVFEHVGRATDEDRAALRAAFHGQAAEAKPLCNWLQDHGLLTPFQAELIIQGGVAELYFAQDYLLLDRIGQGGMGVLYRARHLPMERDVAIKQLLDASPELIRRFEKETRIIAKFSHPNIVQAWTAGKYRDSHFLVMEYLEGDNLQEVGTRGPLDVKMAVDYTLQAAAGLAEAHAHQIVHRDVKPANLLLEPGGTVKVLDLGLAREMRTLADAMKAESSVTQEGQLLGTISYMAPEQYEAAARVDHRADIYSLGCCLYFLLVGRPPHAGCNLYERLRAMREDPPPSLCASRPDVTSELDAVFRRMLEADPERRWGSMKDVIRALQGLDPTLPQASRGTFPAASSTAYSAISQPAANAASGPGSPLAAPYLSPNVVPQASGVGCARRVTIEVQRTRQAGYVLYVRGWGGVEETAFDEQNARQLAQWFGESYQFEHGLQHPQHRQPQHELEQLGQRLWSDVLTGPTGPHLHEHFDQSAQDLQVWIQGTAALANLPWEVLTRENRFVFFEENVPLARTIPHNTRLLGWQQARRQPKLRVLLVPAQPRNLGPVHGRETCEELRQRLWFWQALGLLDLEVLDHATDWNTLDRLRRRLQQRRGFDVVCLLAHGEAEGPHEAGGPPRIALVGAHGEPDWLAARDLVPPMTSGGELPRLVVLGCCHLGRSDSRGAFGGISQELLEQGIPAVLSMQSTVSTQGAAVAIHATLHSLLNNAPIGRAVLACRHELGSEWPLPVLWLHPSCDPIQPLLIVEPKPISELLREVQEGIGHPAIAGPTAEKLLANLRYVRERQALPDAHDRARAFLEQQLCAAAEQRMGRCQRANDREGLARDLCHLLSHCDALAGPTCEEARATVERPLREPLERGLEHEGSQQWADAIRCFQAACEAEADGENTELLWRELRRDAWLHLQYARGNHDLTDGGLWDEAALERQSRGLALLEWLAAHAPQRFSHLSQVLELRRQELEAARLAAEARRPMHLFQWTEARRALQRAHEVQPLFGEDLRLVETCLALQEKLAVAQEAALARRWSEACQRFELDVVPLYEAALKATSNAPAADSAAAWRRGLLQRWWQTECDPLRTRWRVARQVDELLEQVEAGVRVTCQGWEHADVIQALAVQAVDRERVVRLRARLPAELPAAWEPWLQQELDTDWPLCLVLQHRWKDAHLALGSLSVRSAEIVPLWHRLAVAGMALATDCERPLPEDIRAKHWSESLRAWSKVLGQISYWSHWAQPEGSWTQASYERLRAGIREFVARHLALRDDADVLLDQASRLVTMETVDHVELLDFGLELARQTLQNLDFARLERVWRTTIAQATRANRLRSTCADIFSTVQIRTQESPDDSNLRVDLWEIASRVLNGTEKHSASEEQLAAAYLERGRSRLWLRFGQEAFADLEQAYRLQPCSENCALYVMAMSLVADEEVQLEDARRICRFARDEVGKARGRWPERRLLERFAQALDNAKALNREHISALVETLFQAYAFED